MKTTTRTCLSWLAVIAGIGIIFGGCFLSITLRNPGGPPVPISEAKRAIQLAYIAFAVGAFIAIAVPIALIWFGRDKSSKNEYDKMQNNEQPEG